MMTVYQFRRELRQRFLAARGLRPLLEIQTEIGLSMPTLAAFVHGKPVTTSTLETIERWVVREESHEAAQHLVQV